MFHITYVRHMRLENSSLFLRKISPRFIEQSVSTVYHTSHALASSFYDTVITCLNDFSRAFHRFFLTSSRSMNFNTSEIIIWSLIVLFRTGIFGAPFRGVICQYFLSCLRGTLVKYFGFDCTTYFFSQDRGVQLLLLN